MKILSVIDVVPGAPMEKIRAEIAHEVREVWRRFSENSIRELYATDKPTRVVFVLEASDLAAAAADLDALPLIAAGLLRYELTELRPFTNWSLLFGAV